MSEPNAPSIATALQRKTTGNRNSLDLLPRHSQFREAPSN
jgi:hypothetical protein